MLLRSKFILYFILFSLVFSSSCNSQEKLYSPINENKASKVIGSITPKNPTKEEILGSILGGALQTMHFSQKKIDENLSKEAFKVFLERIDYGKQFLLESEVEKLRKYESLMSEEIKSGRLDILDETQKILKPRLEKLSNFVAKELSKPMSFKDKESIETDPKKRVYLKTISDLEKYWRKLLKYEILARMLEKKDEQDGVDDDKKKKKKKSDDKSGAVKLSDKELEKEAREVVAKRYEKYFKRVMDEKKNDRLDKFYNSFTRVFDPHTSYLIPEEKEDFDIDMSGQLQGIGALLREDGSFIKVERIIPGSASWKGKELEAEDTILAVGQSHDEPVDVVDMSLRDAVKMIRGPKGTTVKLTVKKPDGSTKVIPIVRDVVIIEESYAKSAVLIDNKLNKKIGYIFLPKFYRDFNTSGGKNCSDDVKAEIEKLKNENVDSLILDLRNNGGGALEDAKLMSGLFIKKGPIVQVKSSNGTKEVLSDTNPKIDYTKPLIVLVNRFSASASEILAAALQDYERAVIVGASEQTHGKGTVQALIDLDNYASPLANPYKPLGALKITIQMFYRITGGSTQFRGVIPDIILPDPFAYIESGEGALEHAIPYHEVEPVNFEKWDGKKFNLTKLKENSQKRVAQNERFKLITDSLEWYSKRKDMTLRSLNIDEMMADRTLVREKSKEFKNEEEIKTYGIKTFIEARDEVQKELKENFIKTLATDPVIEESIQIALDML